MPSLINKLIYQETKSFLGSAASIVFVNYDGFTQEDADFLRQEVKKEQGKAFLLKKSVALLVLKEMGYDVDSIFQGSVLALVSSEPVGISKAVAAFQKKNKTKGAPLGGIVDGVLVSADDVLAISKLPSREGLISQVLSVMVAPLRGLAIALDAIRKQKEESAA